MLFYMYWKKNAALIGLLLLAATAFAVELRLPDDNEALTTEAGSFDTDYLFFGSKLAFNGTAEDLYFIGSELDLNGRILQDIIAGGRDLSLDGDIEGDLMAGAERLTVNGLVGDTTFLMGKTITIGPEAIINGALFAAGSEVTIHGTVNGEVRIGAGTVTVDGTINGNLIVQSRELILTDRARIIGDLVYDTDDPADARTAGKVGGTVRRTDFNNDREFRGPQAKRGREGHPGFMVFMTLSLMASLIGGGLLLLLIPVFRSVFPGGLPHKGFWSTLLWGMIPLFLYPVVVLILVPLFPVSLALALAGLPLFSLAAVLGITRFGEYMFGVFKWKKVNRFQFFLFGLLLLIVPMMIPGVGLLAWLFVSAAGWGLILKLLGKKHLPDTLPA